MRVDRKLLLILSTVVLVLAAAGLFYMASQLRRLVVASDDLPQRVAFVDSVEHGQRHLTTPQALNIIDFSLRAEANRTAAIDAARDSIQLIAWITVGCCVLLTVAIRRVPRETEPRSGDRTT